LLVSDVTKHEFSSNAGCAVVERNEASMTNFFNLLHPSASSVPVPKDKPLRRIVLCADTQTSLDKSQAALTRLSPAERTARVLRVNRFTQRPTLAQWRAGIDRTRQIKSPSSWCSSTAGA
jgi:hypothetical protein